MPRQLQQQCPRLRHRLRIPPWTWTPNSLRSDECRWFRLGAHARGSWFHQTQSHSRSRHPQCPRTGGMVEEVEEVKAGVVEVGKAEVVEEVKVEVGVVGKA